MTAIMTVGLPKAVLTSINVICISRREKTGRDRLRKNMEMSFGISLWLHLASALADCNLVFFQKLGKLVFSHMVGNTGLLHILAHATCLESVALLTAEMAPRDTGRVGMPLRGTTEVSLVFMSRLPLRTLKYWFHTAGATHTGVPWETSQILFSFISSIVTVFSMVSCLP